MRSQINGAICIFNLFLKMRAPGIFEKFCLFIFSILFYSILSVFVIVCGNISPKRKLNPFFCMKEKWFLFLLRFLLFSTRDFSLSFQSFLKFYFNTEFSYITSLLTIFFHRKSFLFLVVRLLKFKFKKKKAIIIL